MGSYPTPCASNNVIVEKCQGLAFLIIPKHPQRRFLTTPSWRIELEAFPSYAGFRPGINPWTFPGLKHGVCSGLMLSRTLHLIQKDGAWRRRRIDKSEKPDSHSQRNDLGFLRRSLPLRNLCDV